MKLIKRGFNIRSLRLSNLLILTATSACVVLVALGVYLFHQSGEEKANVEGRALALATMISNSLREPLNNRNIHDIEIAAQVMRAEPTVVALRVIDVRGTELYKYAKTAEFADLLMNFENPGLYPQDSLTIVVQPVYQKFQFLGGLAIAVSRSPLDSIMGRSVRLALLLFLASLGLALYLGVRFEPFMRRPHRQMIRAIDSVLGATDGKVRQLSWKEDDELGLLAERFNTILQSVYRQRDERRERESKLVQEMRLKSRALAARDSCLHAIFDESPNPALMMDAEGLVLSINEAARKLFGLAKTERPRFNLRELVNTAAKGSLDRLLSRTTNEAAGEDIHEELQVELCPPGARAFAAEVSIRSFTMNGELSFILHVRDVSRERDLAMSLETAGDVRSEEIKQSSLYPEHLAQVRSGIEFVRLGLEMAQELDVEEERIHVLGGLEHMLGNMLQIVRTIGDLTSVNHGLLLLDRLPFSMHDFNDYLMAYQAEDRQPRVAIDLRLQPGVPSLVFGDPFLLWRLLEELRVHATQHSAEPTLVVKVSASSLDGSRRMLVIEVDLPLMNSVDAWGDASGSSSKVVFDAKLSPSALLMRRLVELVGGVWRVHPWGTLECGLPFLEGVGGEPLEFAVVREVLAGKKVFILDSQATSAQLIKDLIIKQLRMQPVYYNNSRDAIRELESWVAAGNGAELAVVDGEILESAGEGMRRILDLLEQTGAPPLLLKGGSPSVVLQTEQGYPTVCRLGKPLVLSAFLKVFQELFWPTALDRVREKFSLFQKLDTRRGESWGNPLDVIVAAQGSMEQKLIADILCYCGHNVAFAESAEELEGVINTAPLIRGSSEDRPAVSVLLLDADMPSATIEQASRIMNDALATRTKIGGPVKILLLGRSPVDRSLAEQVAGQLLDAQDWRGLVSFVRGNVS